MRFTKEELQLIRELVKSKSNIGMEQKKATILYNLFKKLTSSTSIKNGDKHGN